MAYLEHRLFSREELEQLSASRKHGISANVENRWKRTAINLIVEAGQRLRMDHLAISTAIVLFHRYFATHSLLLNDRFLVAMACLYLGGKLEDTPKSAKDIIAICCQNRYGGEALARVLRGQDFVAAARDRLFLAERAVLCAVRFDIVVQHPFQPLLQALSQQPLLTVLQDWRQTQPTAPPLQQMCINVLNDSYKLPLCLMYRPGHVALACIWTVLKVLRVDARRHQVPGALPWWARDGLTPSLLQEISTLLLDEMYALDSVQTTGTDGDASLQGVGADVETVEEYDELLMEMDV